MYHSFRHTVKDGFRNFRVPKECRGLLRVHVLQGGENCGEGAILEALAREMNKLCFPGLDLGRLCGNVANE